LSNFKVTYYAGQYSTPVFLPLQPEVVWDYLPIAGLIEQWLMKNDFE
jgi:hypothetical protein